MVRPTRDISAGRPSALGRRGRGWQPGPDARLQERLHRTRCLRGPDLCLAHRLMSPGLAGGLPGSARQMIDLAPPVRCSRCERRNAGVAVVLDLVPPNRPDHDAVAQHRLARRDEGPVAVGRGLSKRRKSGGLAAGACAGSAERANVRGGTSAAGRAVLHRGSCAAVDTSVAKNPGGRSTDAVFARL